ncbi:MAG: ABC transporter permease [Acidobacteriota bacterium]|nr:ABC transporter permease [Acidobacteriota bacterium]
MRRAQPASTRPGEVGRALEVAVDSLRTDRVRTRAALVALALAMAIVVCLTTLVERGRAATIRSLERAGLKNVYLVHRPGAAAEEGRGLGFDDVERLRAVLPVLSAVGIRMSRPTVLASGAPFEAPLYAVSGPAAALFSTRVREGRPLGELDLARKSPYCVIGSSVARAARLSSPVGSVLAVGTRTYEIVGELSSAAVEGASAGELPSFDWNRAIVVPLGAEPEPAAEPDGRYPLDVAVLAFSSIAEADAAAAAAPRIDPARCGAGGPVRVASPIQTLRQYRQARSTFDRIVLVVGLLTAASAILGISNLLSASVLARRKEIGLRRAVGARTRDIVLQFRLEAALLGALGGGAGLFAGWLIGIASVDRSAGGSSLSLLSFSALAIACVAAGAMTGIRPSRRAARIDPAAALREG